MTSAQERALLAFLAAHRRKFAQIARRTRYEYEPGDVENEAWLIADTMVAADASLDLADADVQDRLLARVYKQLVEFRETHVRYAERLDRTFNDDSGFAHPLAGRLPADGGADPLSTLLDDRPVHAARGDPDPYASKAAAYVRLWYRCGQSMPAVAGFLLISLSHCYRCYRRAGQFADRQPSLPGMALPHDDDNALVPWRTERAERPARQLELFPVLPELWASP